MDEIWSRRVSTESPILVRPPHGWCLKICTATLDPGKDTQEGSILRYANEGKPTRNICNLTPLAPNAYLGLEFRTPCTLSCMGARSIDLHGFWTQAARKRKSESTTIGSQAEADERGAKKVEKAGEKVQEKGGLSVKG
ncbi:hypothetical protein V6N13_117855 [Hibiscus sabdariffa]|uniref:Nucleoplasmin-like domain-containing protein n=1 Tax=Hibiscus sabdariffa TaxID=183260 RepID=A0ABR2Q9H2_9ROSI